MEGKYIIGGAGVIVAGVVAIGATFLPGKEGKINRLCYWLDAETCIGLKGAVFNIGDVATLAAECTNLSSVELNILVTFKLTYPDGSVDTDAASLPMQPNQTTTFDYYAVLDIAGDYELTVTMYDETAGKELDRKTVDFTVADIVPPICTLGEIKCEGPNLLECQLVDNVADWVLVEENSTACGFVCTEGEYKCVGVDRHICQNNEWVLYEQNSLACGYIPGDFIVSDLSISPDPANVGEEVLISALVTNTGTTAGTHTVYLTGDFTGSAESALLLPGKLRRVGIKVIPTAAGTYHIEFGGLPGSFTVTGEPPVCTLGQTECRGADLWECQIVGTEPDWVLIEENSIECGYIPGIEFHIDGVFIDGVDITTVELSQGIANLVLRWTSDMVSESTKLAAATYIKITDPDGIEFSPVLSGLGTIVAPGDTDELTFSVNFNKDLTWGLSASLTLDLA